MTKVFISQPMNGKTNEQIRIEREGVIHNLIERGFEIIDTVISDNPPSTVKDSIWYLGKSILMLAQANAAYFMYGWRDARGCIIEHEIVLKYNVPIIHD